MLETIREYASDRLVESGELDTIREAHASFFFRLAGNLEMDLIGPRQSMWMRRLDGEIDNIRAALRWFIGKGRAGAALQLAGNLWRYWDSRALFEEGRRWLSAGLAITGGVDPIGRTYERLGTMSWRQGNLHEAQTLLERQLAQAQEAGDEMTVAGTWSTLGLIAGDLGNHEEAQRLQEASLTLRRSLGDGRFIAHSLSNLAGHMLRQRRFAEARAYAEEALQLSREAGDTWFYGIELVRLGFAVLGQEDADTALTLFQESLRVHRGLGERTESAAGLAGVISVASLRGQASRVARLTGACDGLGLRLYWTEASIAAARSATDPGQWQREWEAGYAMSLDEAIEYALEDDR
jgi:non-specific serine/threonine protein kinase